MDATIKELVKSHKREPESIHSELMRREVLYVLGVAKALVPYCNELPEEDCRMIDYIRNTIEPVWGKPSLSSSSLKR